MWLVSVATKIDAVEVEEDGTAETIVTVADVPEETIDEVEVEIATIEDHLPTAMIEIETMEVEIDTMTDVEPVVVTVTIDVIDLPTIVDMVDTGGETGVDLPWLVLVDAAVPDLVLLLHGTVMIVAVATIETAVGHVTMTVIVTTTIPTEVVEVVVVDVTTMSMWAEETLEAVVPRTCTAVVETIVVTAVREI
jgi:hypothetical protein